MPSFSSIATLALALFSASTAFASGLGAVEADLVQRDSLNGGSLFEKRWNNHGKTCSPHKSNWCKTDVHHGTAWCGKDKHNHYRCEWGCSKGYAKRDGKCVRKSEDVKCRHHHHCETNVKHATAFCHIGKCTYHCNPGFHVTKNGQCATVEKYGKCGNKHCPTVQGGWSTCEHGECHQYCEAHSGYKLFTNKNKTAYKCINVANDKNNCGKPGHVCPAGYHHKGEPVCHAGKCTLNCHGYKVGKTSSGVSYCSHKKA